MNDNIGMGMHEQEYIVKPREARDKARGTLQGNGNKFWFYFKPVKKTVGDYMLKNGLMQLGF